jgi:acylpyruvate hydrolase
MRIITFEINGQTRWGALANDYAVDLNLAHALYLASHGRAPEYLANNVLDFLQHGETAWDAARETLDFLSDRVVDGVMYPRARVKLLAPIQYPPDIICIGRNYAEHAREGNAEVPTYPVLFSKFSSAVIGPDAVIHLHPNETQKVDYEGELGVVMGKTAREVSAAEALDYVFGYTVVNDVSARDLQFSPYAQGQWIRGKGLDTFCPMGPFVVSKDEIPDPQNLSVRTRVNGQVMQDGNTQDMIFDVAHLIEFISHGIALLPGDIIATGTPPGVGHYRNPPVYLRPGDVVQIEIGKIGTLSNEVQE